MSPASDFQTLLRHALEKSGVTQRKLAETCDISHALIQSMLTGKSAPNPKRVGLMADALNLEGEDRDQFIDAAKRSLSHEDISQELQDLRKSHADLVVRHEKLKERVHGMDRRKG